jgi:hypothetical protein
MQILCTVVCMRTWFFSWHICPAWQTCHPPQQMLSGAAQRFTGCNSNRGATLQAASRLFFGTGADGTNLTVKGWFEGCSMGQTTLSRTGSRVVSVSLPCSGPSPWNYTWTSKTCDAYAYAEAANQAVEAAGLATVLDYT